MAVEGAKELDRALAAVAEDATDKNVHKAAGTVVMIRSRAGSRSRRVRATGKVTAGDKRAWVSFGSPKVPWTRPSHFGHGSPGKPRPQGGYMLPNKFIWRGSDQARPEVVDLYLTRTVKAIRDNGF